MTARVRRRLRVSDEHALDHAGTQIAYHGPGLTFGELAIGDAFHWPPPIPRGPEPMVKSADDRYQWSKGYGTAEAFYRVERWVP